MKTRIMLEIWKRLNDECRACALNNLPFPIWVYARHRSNVTWSWTKT